MKIGNNHEGLSNRYFSINGSLSDYKEKEREHDEDEGEKTDMASLCAGCSVNDMVVSNCFYSSRECIYRELEKYYLCWNQR